MTSSEQPSSEQRPTQDADPTREPDQATAAAAGTPDDATGAAANTGQVDEPAKKHGDPLLNEAEGRHGAADVPDTGAGTASSATA